MTDTPQLLLAHHLKTLKLPTFLREYDKLARQCAAEGADHVRYLIRLAELELIDRERRMVERRIRQAKFPAVKSLDSFDFKAIASLNKMLVLELARCEYIDRRENVIALGNSGTGKTHIALGLAACQKGLTVGFITAAALVHELIEARDEKRLLRLQKQLAKYKLLIIDELGFVPLSKTGAELLFEVFSQRYERGSTLLTSNLPFDEWTEVFGSERLTGALLDRLTHHVQTMRSVCPSSCRRRRSRLRAIGACDIEHGPVLDLGFLVFGQLAFGWPAGAVVEVHGIGDQRAAAAVGIRDVHDLIERDLVAGDGVRCAVDDDVESFFSVVAGHG